MFDLNLLTPLLTKILSKQNQLMLPIIMERIDNVKNMRPWCLHTVNIVLLDTIHIDGVVGLRKVIKKPDKNALEVFFKIGFSKLWSVSFRLNETLLDKTRIIPDNIQNKLSNLGFLDSIVNIPKFIIII